MYEPPESHPMWVRGLKHFSAINALCGFQSHPMWVRGLKLIYVLEYLVIQRSHPMWVRGLKQKVARRTQQDLQVAPHVGAWIETKGKVLNILSCIVAPHVGAWIETVTLVASCPSIGSHPMWVRGLKPQEQSRCHPPNHVAPHVGAWIETVCVR